MSMKKEDTDSANRRMLLSYGLLGAALLPLARSIAKSAEKPRKAKGNPILGGNGGLHHAAVQTNDWNRTLEFYEKGLGFSVMMVWSGAGDFPRGGYIDSGDGTCLEIIEHPGYVPPPLPTESEVSRQPITHICLRTTRFDAAFENAVKFGAAVVLKPIAFPLHTTTGQGVWPLRLCMLGGPSGEVIELLENAP